MNRNNKLINRIMWHILLSCSLYCIITQLENILDNSFSNSYLGVTALATVQLGKSIDSFIRLPAKTLGVGGNVKVCNLLGKRDTEGASRVFSFTLFIGLMISVLIVLIGFPFAEQIANAISGTTADEGLVRYIRIALLGTPIYCLSAQLILYTSTDNHIHLNSIFTTVSIIIKIACEVLFLSVLHLGIEGVALSSCIGYGLGLFVYTPYIRSKERTLRFVNPMKNAMNTLKELFPSMQPALISSLGVMLSSLFIKMTLIRLGGNSALALYSVANTVEYFLIWMLVGGVLTLLDSSIGILYGEKDYYGIKAMMKRVISFSIGIVGGVGLLIALFPKLFLQCFGLFNDQMFLMQKTVIYFSVIYCLILIVFLIAQKYYLSITHKKIASVLSFMKEVAFSFPLQAGLSYIAVSCGLGIEVGFMIGLILSVFIPIVVNFIYLLRTQKVKDLWLLPQDTETKKLEVSATNSIDEIPSLLDTVIEFCNSIGLDEIMTNHIALGTEEAFHILCEINPPKSCYIDITIRVVENGITLMLRSDGVVFNPIEYESKAEQFNSLFMLKKIASSYEYMRVMYLNNSIYYFENTH